MRYTYEFKRKEVELYRQGKWIDLQTKDGSINMLIFKIDYRNME